MIKSAKTRKALIGIIVAVLIQIAAIVAQQFGVEVPMAYVVLLTSAIAGLFGVDIAGHVITNIAAIKAGKEEIT